MIPQPRHKKIYGSARLRFLAESIESLFARELPQYFGPVLSERLAQEIVSLIDAQMPARQFLRPGQCIWNAVSAETRPDSPRRRLVPVVLTLTCEDDARQLAEGIPMSQVARQALARICTEAQEQGALLTMRDIGLLVWRDNAIISTMRQRWEQDHDQLLPHPGSLQDFGSGITHKTAIVHKAIYEKKDPRRVANETRHSQRAVDRYLTDFHRVKTAYLKCPQLDFVCGTTGLSRHLVRQYLNLIQIKEKKS